MIEPVDRIQAAIERARVDGADIERAQAVAFLVDRARQLRADVRPDAAQVHRLMVEAVALGIERTAGEIRAHHHQKRRR